MAEITQLGFQKGLTCANARIVSLAHQGLARKLNLLDEKIDDAVSLLRQEGRR